MPSVAETLFVALVGVVDTMMVGNLGAAAIAAVGLTTQPKFMGLALFISLNSAVTSVVARRYGERDREDANNVLFNGLLLTIAITCVISVVFVKYSYNIVAFMEGDAETTALADGYLKIIMAGFIFTTVTMFINACQRGTGNTKISFRTNLVSNIVNIIFNYLLIEGKWGFPRMEVNGAALATVIGSVVGLVLAFSSVLKSQGFLYLFSHSKLGFRRSTLSSLNKIWLSGLTEQACLRFGFLMFTRTVSSLGTTCFAAHQIGMNICLISFSTGDGMSQGTLALVGKALGEKDLPKAKKHVKCSLNIGRLETVFTSILFFFFGKQLFMMFTDEPGVLEYSVFISCILGIATLVQIPALVFSGTLRGAGDAGFIAVMSLFSVAILRPSLGWLFTYPLGFGLRGAWVGFLIDQTTRFLFVYGRYKTGKWENIKI